MVSWNRIREAVAAARAFEAAGRPVLITENASWGNDFQGDSWLTLAKGYHNMAGCFPIGGNDRWDNLNHPLMEWRRSCSETLILPQRGIGPPSVSMPRAWPSEAQARYLCRMRSHPGRAIAKSLQSDLHGIGRVITWGSGAAIKALMLGVSVVSDMPNWIGEQQNTDESRLAMFRRLAWAQWRLDEFRSGEAFEWMLG